MRQYFYLVAHTIVDQTIDKIFLQEVGKLLNIQITVWQARNY